MPFWARVALSRDLCSWDGGAAQVDIPVCGETSRVAFLRGGEVMCGPLRYEL